LTPHRYMASVFSLDETYILLLFTNYHRDIVRHILARYKMKSFALMNNPSKSTQNFRPSFSFSPAAWERPAWSLSAPFFPVKKIEQRGGRTKNLEKSHRRLSLSCGAGGVDRALPPSPPHSPAAPALATYVL
jgi:hypothetical protein